MKFFQITPAIAGFSTLLGLLSSCASTPRSAARADFDFSKIKSIEIKAKDSISPIISRELLLNGITPIAKMQNSARADAILRIATTREHPEKRYIVKTSKKTIAQQTTSSKTGEQTSSTVQFEEEPGHPPIEVSGSQAFSQSVFGSGGDSRLIATYAQVVLSGELVTPKGGEVIWAGSYSYEGIDFETALEGAIHGLIREIPLNSRP